MDKDRRLYKEVTNGDEYRLIKNIKDLYYY